MAKDELVAYYRHLDNIVICVIISIPNEKKEGREEANLDNARNLKKTGSSN